MTSCIILCSGSVCIAEARGDPDDAAAAKQTIREHSCAHLFFAEFGMRYDEGNINNVVEGQHRSISWETKKGGGHGISNAIVPWVGVGHAVTQELCVDCFCNRCTSVTTEYIHSMQNVKAG